MAQAAGSVTTCERSQTGRRTRSTSPGASINREQFDANYEGLVITEEQRTTLQELASHPNGPRQLVVIGEDWCPDVCRSMPVAARIGETLRIEMRFFERDQNKDMIAEYLKDGEFESIPVLIFYNADHVELCHLIERPALANEPMSQLQEVLADMRPEAIAQRLGHDPSEEEIQEARAAAGVRYLEWQRTSETWANWRSATVDEVIGLLRGAV